MKTRIAIAAIAVAALGLSELHWVVRNMHTLLVLFAVVAAVAVVAGGVTKGVKRLGKAEEPKALPKPTSVDDIDWSQIVLNTPLPNERKDA